MATSTASAPNPFLASQGGKNPFMGASSTKGASASAPVKNPFLSSNGGSNPFMNSTDTSVSSTPTPQGAIGGEVASAPPISKPSTWGTGNATAQPTWGSGNATPQATTGGTQQPTTGQTTQQSGGLGGLLHNIGSGLSNAYHRVGGAIAGAGDSLQNDIHDVGEAVLNPFRTQLGMQPVKPTVPLSIPLVKAAQGAINPGQQAQYHAQTEKNLHQGAFGKFVENTVESPASYIPVAPILKATGVTPALKFGWDLAKGAVKTGKEAETVAQGATTAAKSAVKPNPYTNVAKGLTHNAPGKTEKVAQILQKRATQKMPKIPEPPKVVPNPYTHAAAQLTEHAPGKTEKVATILQKRANNTLPKLSASRAADVNIRAGIKGGYNGIKKTLPDDVANQFFHDLSPHELQQLKDYHTQELQDLHDTISPGAIRAAAKQLRDTEAMKNGGDLLAHVRSLGGLKISGSQYEDMLKRELPASVRAAVSRTNGRPLDEIANHIGTDTNELVSKLKDAKPGPMEPASKYIEQAKQAIGHDDVVNQINELQNHMGKIDQAIEAYKDPFIAPEKVGQNYEMRGGPLATIPKPPVEEPKFQLRGGQLMVIPQATEQAAEEAGLHGATQAATKAPYAAYKWQSELGAKPAQTLQHYFPNGIIGAKQAIKGIEHVFTALPGARQYFKSAISQFHGNKQSADLKAANDIVNAFKGTTPEEQVAITHALESSPEGAPLADPRLEAIRQKVAPLLSQATQTALEHGLIDGTMNPAEMGVGQYIPHVVAGKFDTEGAPIYHRVSQGLRPTMDAAKSRELTGTIAEINHAAQQNPEAFKELYDHYGMKPGEKLFEDNLVNILSHHNLQLNHAVAVKKLINTVMAHGKEVPSDFLIPKGYTHPETKTPVGLYTHEGKTVMLPKTEADYMNRLNQKPSTLSNAYRWAVNLANQGMFLGNPFIHIGTNLGSQTLLHAPKAIPYILHNIPEAFKGVQPGSPMDKAVQAGAMHLASEIGTKGNVAQKAEDIYKAVNPTPLSKIKKIAGYYTKSTPILEKAYRGGLHQYATEKLGQTPEQAAQKVRSIYGGRIAPDVVAPAEQVLQGAMPFINWTKTAIGSNLANAARNPVPYNAIAHGLNAINEATTGHGQLQNQNPLYVGLPETNAQGLQKYVEPYFPAYDAAKLAKDVASEGLGHGLADFAFTRSNPFFKYPIQYLTNLQNPFAPTPNQFNVDPYQGNPLIPPSAHQQAWKTQLGQDFSLQGVGKPNTNPTLLDRGLQTLGGYINAPNPQTPAKEAKYNQRNWKSQYKKWLKQQAGGQ